MAENTVVKDAPANPCCGVWKEKYSKLQQKYAKLEDGRSALRRCIDIFEQQIAKMQTENEDLKKAYEEERVRAENERKEKEKVLGDRASLEDEISALKSQILSLQQKEGLEVEDMNEEVKDLKARLSEVEAETKPLHDLLEKERQRADSLKKKVESEEKRSNEASQNAKAEKNRADKEREEKIKESDKRVALEKEISALKSQILPLQQKEGLGVENMNEEVKDLKARLSEVEAETKRLNDLLEKERKRADSLKKKVESEEKKSNEASQNAKAEKNRADKEREDKIKELDKKVALEKEISSLRSEILSLQQNKGSRDKDLDEEITLLRTRLSEGESEISRLKELLEKEKKKAEAEKKKANEEKRLAKAEGQKAEEYRHQLEKLKTEAGEVKSKLVSEIANSEDAKKKLAAERQKAIKEKKRADAETANAEEQRKFGELNKMKAMEEKSIADYLSKQLVEEKGRSEKLQKQLDERINAEKLKDGVQLKRQAGESKSNLETKKRLENEKKRADSGMKKAEEQRKVAEAFKEKAMEEKNRAGQLAQELKEHKQKIAELQKEIKERLVPLDENRNAERDRMRLLKKQLKFERTKLKHTKEVVKLEKGRSSMLQHELRRLKDEFLQFSDRLKILDGFFSQGNVGIDLGKTGKKLVGTEPLLPTLGGNCTESVSGIDSQLVPLLRGSNRKTLQSCPINSSLGSFSDRPLVGSQGRCTVSVSETAKFAEEIKSNPQPNRLKLPGELRTKVTCNENIAVVAENNVRSPLKTGANRKRILDAVASVEHLHSEGQKLHLQLSENLAVLHDMLGSQEKINAKQEKSRKKRRVDLRNCNEQNDKIGCKGNKEAKDDLGISEVTDVDFMKLFKLDNSDDERKYQLAMARPLSPLPERYLNCIDKFKTKKQKQSAAGDANDDFVPDCSSDAMNTETESGNCKHNTDNSAHVPPLQKELNVEVNDENACASQICEAVPTVACKSYLGSECSYLPKYCVVFSDITDTSSASKVFCATRTCLAQCPVISDKDLVVQTLIFALSKVEGLFLKEKVCVFFSLLLHNFSWVTLENFTNFSDGDLAILNSFAEEMRHVLSDLEARSTFAELCNLDELLALVEDFLINRRVLVCTDKSSYSLLDSDPTADISLNSEDVVPSPQNASTNQLVAGAVVVASVFAAIDQIGFICEASFNIFRLQKIDSPMLTVLHVFACICGPKYFTLDDHHLIMTVIKSLITFVEGANSSVDSSSILQPDIRSCTTNCPFSEGSVCMDLVVSMLLEKLQNSQAVMTESLKLINLEGRSLLEDILFLLELVACKMSWGWTCSNIVPQLLKLLESCAAENLLAAVIILLGQIGRFGVEAKGYEDSAVQNIRDRLSAFLCQITSKKTGLTIQVATVSALLGVISLNFEELIRKSNSECPLLVSNSIPSVPDCIIKWFSVLNKEQQSVSFSLLSAVAH